MKTLYLKPLGNDKLLGLSELVALYKNNYDDVINVGYPGEAPYKPQKANMAGFNSSVEKAMFIARDEFKDTLTEEVVYEIQVTEDNKVFDSKNITGYGVELDSYLAGDLSVLKRLGLK
jgi:hypothetical protein